MQFFKISKDQIEHIAGKIGEFPLKHMISIVDVLRSLVPIAEEIIPATKPVVDVVEKVENAICEHGHSVNENQEHAA